MKNKAFTLIELLVVISIIALLASIILGSLQGARDKAFNAQTNQQIMEYAKALELAFSKNGVYPSATLVCLGGGYPIDKCGLCPIGFDCPTSVDPGTNGILDDFISSLPPVGSRRINVGDGTNEWLGAVYRYGTMATTRYIQWDLIGTGQKCAKPPNSTTLLETTSFSITICKASLP